MCAVSNVGDEANKQWDRYIDSGQPWRIPEQTSAPIITIPEIKIIPDDETLQHKSIVDWLQKLDKILIAARQFDIATNQPDCEVAEKMATLKKLAGLYNVDMEFLKSG
jgi:hypothetical protein